MRLFNTVLSAGFHRAAAPLSAFVLLLAAGCGDQASKPRGGAERKKLIVCTTTMIADLARQIGGEHLEVVGIMKTGVDPHVYDPTPDDSILFRKADLVLINGLHLEGRMLDMIAAVGGRGVELGHHPGIKLRQSAAAGAPDPHVWWNVRHFRLFAEQAAEAFRRVDPVHGDAYSRRAADYTARLDILDNAVRESVRTIPERARYMITSHDAFFYYGEAYGLAVDAVLGISTDAQAKADEPRRLAQIASERKVPAIFHETSVSAAQNELVDRIRELSREKYGHEIKIAGPLYSDSLGDGASGADTYVSAVTANTRMIVAGLGGSPSETLIAMNSPVRRHE